MTASILHCLRILAEYVALCLLILVPVRRLTGIPSFVFRKLLHFVAFSGVTIMIFLADSWQAAVLTALVIAVLIFPALWLLESVPWFGELLVQKSKGEIKKSFLLLLAMFSAVTAVCWGAFGKPYLAAAAILMWGTGDAAAALVGIPYGKHKIQSRFTDGKKSREGSFAMLLVAFISGLIVLCGVQGMPVTGALFGVFLGALSGTGAELFSPSEYDTVTVPIAIAAVLLLAGI